LRNDAGRWTKPSPQQYPHQWNWDSGFISLGWATFDWERAVQELESMLAARWREGMVPHLHYDSRYLDAYFPGPDRWPHAAAHVGVPGQLTSGISNPPILVMAALRVGLRQPSVERRRSFWRRTYRDLRGFLEYFGRRRRLGTSPLVAMVHPWESGWDNSPRWDHLAEAGLKPERPYRRLDTAHVEASQRPTGRDYDGYLRLVELLDGVDYDAGAYRARSPFCVYDALLDALWYRGACDLNQIAGDLDEPAPFPRTQLEGFRTAYEAAHWDPDQALYLDWDCVAGRRIARVTAAGVAAMAGGVMAPDRARRAWQRYLGLCGSARMVCTVPPGDPSFDASRYWRGPTWINVNWLVAEGLELAGLRPEAARLRSETLDLVREGGFAEYFDPRDGSPAGAKDFSWSAALTLDLLDRDRS
jgi:hypothetical protein